MPAKAPTQNAATQTMLAACASRIREQRVAMGVSAAVAAHAAGMSRVTWHRIEKAEPSVTMGAYLSALDAMGRDLLVTAQGATTQPAPMMIATHPEPIVGSKKIALCHYPQLRAVAWHVKEDFELTRAEARSLYVRNARYLDLKAMPKHERELFAALVPAPKKNKPAGRPRNNAI